MDRNDVGWRGFWPSCPTPFRENDESIDLDTLRNILEYFVGCGSHGVLINGTVGEWFSQSDEERRAVAETAVDQVAGRMTVVIGCTAYTARQAAEFGRHAASIGADGVEVSAPPYSKPFPDEVVQYFQDISAAVDAPLLVYNWPHGTNVDIGPELFEQVAEIDTVVAIKDSTPNVEQFYETVKRVASRVRVFGPFESKRGIDVLSDVGGDGFIGGGTVFGSPDAEFFEAFWRGDLESCRAHAARSEELFPKLWLSGGWAGVHGAYQSELKVVMRLLGHPAGTVRRPRLPITDPQAIAEIRDALIGAGLLDDPGRS